jgi:hypothetical protein
MYKFGMMMLHKIVALVMSIGPTKYRYYCKYSTYNIFSAANSLYLVTDFNTLLLCPYHLALIS